MVALSKARNIGAPQNSKLVDTVGYAWPATTRWTPAPLCPVAPVATVGLVSTLVQGRSELLRFARKCAASAADAEDALQELCVKVLSQRHTLHDPAKGLPWLKVALRNIVIDGHRRRQIGERAEAAFGEILAANADGDGAPSFASCVCLDAALTKLEPQHADIVTRCDLSREPRTRIASKLGITPGNIRIRVLRARRALRRRLDDECPNCPAYDGGPCICHEGDRG